MGSGIGLPAASSWGLLKLKYPDATYTVYENKDGWNYHTDGRTAWVKVGVTVNGLENIEYLAVMNGQNASIPLKDLTSFDVVRSIQRATAKAIARHGLGLSLYIGEDLREPEEKTKPESKSKKAEARAEESEELEVVPPVVDAHAQRKALVDWCNKKKFKITDACLIHKLNNNSTEEEFKQALDNLISTFGA